MKRFRKVAVIAIAAASMALLVPVASEADHLKKNHGLAQMAPVCRVDTDKHVIALTFDDGPDATFTPQVLDFLRDANAKATFFVVGSQVDQHFDLIKRIHDDGHELANHTWKHPRMVHVDAARVREEATRTNAALQTVTTPTLFRAPLGEMSKEQIAAVNSVGLMPLHWNIAVDNLVGGQHLTPKDAAARLASRAHDGDIVLAHDAQGPRRIEALDTLRTAIPELQRKGFEFTTASEVLDSGKGVRAKPRSAYWDTGYVCPR